MVTFTQIYVMNGKKKRLIGFTVFCKKIGSTIEYGNFYPNYCHERKKKRLIEFTVFR